MQTFNEDVIFGDELLSTIEQRTYSYWGDHNSLFSEASMDNLQNNIPSTPECQTPESFEGEPRTPEADLITRDEQHRPTSEGEPTTKIDNVTELPRSRIADDQSSYTDSRSVSPHNSELNSPVESHHSDQTIRNSPPPSSPYCHSQELILQPEDQGESSAEEDLEEIKYDQVMTGWDPVRPIAGQKRPHSPDREYSPQKETMKTRRGRQVVKHDYKRLHYGKSAQISPDPKTWNEAMTCSEATQWKKAADEEFRSLKDKGAIKIIQRTQLPQGRKPMK
ncbi:hypothetical protein K3495_g14985, partial [Podosphaera aphanis]